MIKGKCKEEITALRIIRELLVEYDKGDMSAKGFRNAIWNVIVSVLGGARPDDTKSVYLGKWRGT